MFDFLCLPLPRKNRGASRIAMVMIACLSILSVLILPQKAKSQGDQAKHGQGSAEVTAATQDDIPQIVYRQFSENGRFLVVMTPPKSPKPGEMFYYDRKQPLQPLSRALGYSRAAFLTSDGRSLFLVSPTTEKSDAAIAFYRRGVQRARKTYSIEQLWLMPVSKEADSNTVPPESNVSKTPKENGETAEKPEVKKNNPAEPEAANKITENETPSPFLKPSIPKAWLADILGFKDSEGRFNLLLADGRTCIFDTATGDIVEIKRSEETLPPAKSGPFTCKGYRDALAARKAAGPTYKTTQSVLTNWSGIDTENIAFSPFGLYFTLDAVALGASGNTANEIYRFLGANIPTNKDTSLTKNDNLLQQAGVATRTTYDFWLQQEGLKLEENEKGIEVKSLSKSSSMYQSGVRPGNIISALEYNKVKTVNELQEGIESGIPQVFAIDCYDEQSQAYRTLYFLRAVPTSLSMHSTLWVNEHYPLRSNYLDQIAAVQYASVNSIDFSDINQAIQTISSDTHLWGGKLAKTLVDPSLISSDTRWLLLNTVVFTRRWSEPFDKKIQPGFFHLDATHNKEVEMMHVIDYFRVARFKDAKVTVLEISCLYGEQSMLILLPHEIDGLATFEKYLGQDSSLSNLLKRFDKVDCSTVDLLLPKFKVTSDCPVKCIMQSAGVESAFLTQKADFSPMRKERDIMLDQVLQRSTVEVNQTGISATSATIATGVTLGMKLPKHRVSVDRPFMFIIRDSVTGAILFAGHVKDPSS